LPFAWFVLASGSPAASDPPPPPTVTSVTPDIGPVAGGTSVTVDGTGFVDGSTTVDFGTTPATDVTVTSPTELTATSPVGAAGSVDVTVSVTGAGTSAVGSVDLFAYGPPTVTNVVPGAGAQAGGNTVNVVGTAFVPGATVTFGIVPATDVIVTSATTLTATAPPGFTVDPVDVSVTTAAPDGGTSGLSPNDLYAYGAPSLTALSPTTSAANMATTVTLTGTDFSAGDTVNFGATAATDVTVMSPTSLTAVSPATLSGGVDVTVSNADGTSSTSAATQFAAGPPTVSGVTPHAGGTGTVTITGDGFVAGTNVAFGAVAAAGVTVVSPTSIVAGVPVGNSGSVDITVTTPQGTSPTSVFDLYASGPPVVDSITPNTGPTTGGTSVTISGTDFVPDAVVSFGSAPATDVTLNAAGTSFQATAPPGAASTVDVTVTDSDGTSATSVNDLFGYGTPTVSSVAPDAGPVAGGQDVIVAGTGFVPGTTVYFGATVSPSVTILAGGSGLVAVAPAGTPGAIDITVTTPQGTSPTTLKDAYFYGTPQITGVTPSSGSSAGGTTVTITGTGFSPDSTVTFGLQPATSVTVHSSTQISAVSPAANLGVIPVRVTSPAGISDLTPADNFEYDDQLQLSCAPPPNVSTACDGIELPSVSLQGQWQNATAPANTLYVTDDRNDASVGWSVSAYLVPSPTNTNSWCAGWSGFCNATAGSDSASSNAKIPADYFSVNNVGCAANDGNGSPDPDAGQGGNFPVGAGAVSLCTASAGASAGTFKVGATFSLQVPPWIYAGTYEATVEFLVM
jgi:hypothetical protein